MEETRPDNPTSHSQSVFASGEFYDHDAQLSGVKLPDEITRVIELDLKSREYPSEH